MECCELGMLFRRVGFKNFYQVTVTLRGCLGLDEVVVLGLGGCGW